MLAAVLATVTGLVVVVVVMVVSMAGMLFKGSPAVFVVVVVGRGAGLR